jgi:hypothetical protein
MTTPGAALAALRKRAVFVCAYCGKTFEARAYPPPPAKRYCCKGHKANAAKRIKRNYNGN